VLKVRWVDSSDLRMLASISMAVTAGG